MFEVMTQSLKFFRMMGASSQQRREFIDSLEAEQQASHERFSRWCRWRLTLQGSKL